MASVDKIASTLIQNAWMVGALLGYLILGVLIAVALNGACGAVRGWYRRHRVKEAGEYNARFVRHLAAEPPQDPEERARNRSF